MNSFDQRRGHDRFRSSLAQRPHGAILTLAALLGGVCGNLASAQTTAVEQPIIITITVEGTDSVLYRGTTFDLPKIAKDPGPTTSANTAFLPSTSVADVRSWNGQPAKGIWSYHVVMAMPFRANPQPGQVIADMDSGGFFQCVWQILSSDGKQDPEAANRWAMNSAEWSSAANAAARTLGQPAARGTATSDRADA